MHTCLESGSTANGRPRGSLVCLGSSCTPHGRRATTGLPNSSSSSMDRIDRIDSSVNARKRHTQNMEEEKKRKGKEKAPRVPCAMIRPCDGARIRLRRRKLSCLPSHLSNPGSALTLACHRTDGPVVEGGREWRDGVRKTSSLRQILPTC